MYRIDAKALRAALTRANAIAPRKTHMPILGHVLIETREGTTRLYATDLDRAFAEVLPNTLESPVNVPVVLPCAAFLAATKSAAGDVEIAPREAPGRGATIRTGTGETTLDGLDPAEFPALPALPDDHRSGEVSAADLRLALQWVLPAAATDKTRHNLLAVDFSKDGVAAIDGHRCHIAPPLAVPAMVLPVESARWLARHAPATGVTVTVKVSQPCNHDPGTPNCDHAPMGSARFECSTWVLQSRLADTRFPDWTLVLPKQSDITGEAWLDPIGARKRLATLPKTLTCLRYTLNGALEYEVRDGEGLQSRGVLPIEPVGSYEPVRFGVERRYFVGALRHDGRALFSFTTTYSPMMLTYDDGQRAVVMPMRI